MARIGLKLFYLRTRVRKVSQQQMAKDLGIRQATISHIERGSTQPAAPLIVSLCRYFNVCPNYLLDDARGVVPRPTESWELRDALVTLGMWIEIPKESAIGTPDGKLLCPLLPGEAFYDDEARQLRERAASTGDHDQATLAEQREREERQLVRALQSDLRSHPQRRKGGA